MKKLEDWLYEEVDDSCALCGSRGIGILTVHHIDGDNSNNVYENTIVLCHNCHNRYHQRQGILESDVRDRKRHLIQKTVTTYGVNALKIADRNNTGVIASPFLLYHIVELGYVRNEQPIMEHGSGNERTLEGFNLFSITDKGRAVLREWLSD